MTDALGLSVGAVNLVAARPGQPPVRRRAVLTLSAGRPPEVGVPQENPNLTGTGLMVHGFVDRVGGPAPVATADGSTFRAEELTADALDALARTVGYGTPVCIAVPAHWEAARSEALQMAVRSKPSLNPGHTTAVVVPDAAAAITALRAEPGLPPEGVVALCDFGGSGTSITIVDAATDYRPVAATVRYRAFSGDHIDDAILNHLLTRLPDSGATGVAGTAAVGSLSRLREDCRAAKERLSDRASTVIPVDLPGFTGDVPLNRDELENILAAPLAGVIDAVADALRHNRVPAPNLVAVAAVGGCASIPMVGAQLSERLRVPLITTSQPVCTAATGAALLAQRQPPLGPAASADANLPTSMAAAAWAATAAGIAAGESAADGDQSATFRALAWSQDDSKAFEPVPYSGADYSYDAAHVDPGTQDRREDSEYSAEPEPLAWYKRPVVLFGLAAALALAATGGLAYTLTGEGKRIGNTAPSQPSGEQQPPGSPSTVTITAPNGSTSLSTIPPPPPSDTATESTGTTPTEPTTTPTTTTEPSTSTSTQPTTTEHTTSPAPSSTTQSTQPPSSSVPPPTTTAAPTASSPASSG